MKRVFLVLIAGTVLVGAGAPMATAGTDTPRIRAGGSEPATAQDYKALLRQLEELSETLSTLHSLTRTREGWQPDCRGYSPEKTVRCAAARFDPPGGVDQALGVWRCETGWGYEVQYHTDSYHGPFQYLESTYSGQQSAMPDVVKWFELSPSVHDMRSNIVTAIAWAARNGWYPWTGCA